MCRGFAVALLILVAPILLQAKGAEFKHTHIECMLGMFPSSSPIRECRVLLHNSGDSTLYIESIKSVCSCTTWSILSDTIAPQSTDTIVVQYNGEHRWPGNFSRSILLSSNASNSPLRITLSGYMYDDSGMSIPDSIPDEFQNIETIINYK